MRRVIYLAKLAKENKLGHFWSRPQVATFSTVFIISHLISFFIFFLTILHEDYKYKFYGSDVIKLAEICFTSSESDIAVVVCCNYTRGSSS